MAGHCFNVKGKNSKLRIRPLAEAVLQRSYSTTISSGTEFKEKGVKSQLLPLGAKIGVDVC